jgi:hypothetical protein
MKPLSLCVLLAATYCPAADLASAQPMLRPPSSGYAAAHDPQRVSALTATTSGRTLTGPWRHRRVDPGDRTGTPIRPQLSLQPIYAVKPDGAITLHGPKGESVVDRGPGFGPGSKRPGQTIQPMSVQVASRFGVIGHIEGRSVAGERAPLLLSHLRREGGEYE